MQIQSTNIAHYEYGVLDFYLNNYENGFCNVFDDYIISNLLNRNVAMYRYDRNPNYYAINRFCYLILNNNSYGGIFRDSLKKYYNTNDEGIAVLATTITNEPKTYWVGNQTSSYKISCNRYNGYADAYDANLYHYVRPVINLSENTKAKTINGKIYLTK